MARYLLITLLMRLSCQFYVGHNIIFNHYLGSLIIHMRFVRMRQLISSKILLLVALAALTAGCGSGGGGGDSTSTTPSSSDWGTLVWDQDDWS